MGNRIVAGPPNGYTPTGELNYATQAPVAPGAEAGMSPATGMIGAAGLGALSSLFMGIMQQEEAKKQRKAAEKAAAAQLAYEKEREHRSRQDAAQNQKIDIIQKNGAGEQNALQQLMAVLTRTQR